MADSSVENGSTDPDNNKFGFILTFFYFYFFESVPQNVMTIKNSSLRTSRLLDFIDSFINDE